jgi:hypothetical protein
MQFGAPGNYLTANNRFAQLLAQQPSINNGTWQGGLGEALKMGLTGYILGRDRQDSLAASQALQRGLGPQPMPEGQYGPPQMGGLETASAALSSPDMAQNEYAGRLAQQLRLSQLAQQQDMSGKKSLFDYEQKNKITDVQRYLDSMGYEKGSDEYNKLLGDYMMKSVNGQVPAVLQEWSYYSKLPEKDKSQYLNMKRAAPWLNLGGTFEQPNQAAPGASNANRAVTLKPGEQPAVRGEQASAEAQGKAQGTAAANLPATVANAEQQIGTINQILTHPGFGEVIGLPGSVSGLAAKLGVPVAGTDAAGFMALVDQVRGQSFLDAYQTLKGGGQITEVEGKKATEARSRLMNTGLKPEEYRQAAQDYIGILQKGIERAKTQAAGNTAGPGMPSPAEAPSPVPDGWSVKRVK